jgi:SAM-dependent methyltransferase
LNTAHDIPTLDEVFQYLSGFEQEGGEEWREENECYLRDHIRRFHETLKIHPPGNRGEKLLELGAAPYFMSLMLEHYTKYTVFTANGFRVGDLEEKSIRLVKNFTREEHTFKYRTFNVEIDCFPYPDHIFDIVLCCELLEHLALDPTHMLLETHRILKPGGRILITTPNVLVLRNLVSLLKHRRNIYYPYSGYGVYGRHNREWTLDEVIQIVSGCGYSIEIAQIVDTYPHQGYSKWLKTLFPFFRDMLVVLGRAENETRSYYPENLYESFPRQYSLKNPIPSRLQELQQETNHS